MKFNLFFLCFIISGCVGQPPAPVEYNSGRSFASESMRTKSIAKNNKEILNNNLEEIKGEKIVSIPLTPQQKDFMLPTGYLKDPQIDESTSADDTIIVPKISSDNRKIIYHQVQEGETLAAISRDYNQTIEEVSELNDISPPYDLRKSQMLKIKISNELLNIKNEENNLTNTTKHLNSKMAAPSPLAALPKFLKPVEGEIISKFGESTRSGKNKGINIAAAEGSAVYSIAAGKIIYVGHHKQFGNLLIVKLDKEDLYVAYGHLADLTLKKDTVIQRGEIIGRVGHTGEVNSSQLHLAIREGKTAVNPLKYVKYD